MISKLCVDAMKAGSLWQGSRPGAPETPVFVMTLFSVVVTCFMYYT